MDKKQINTIYSIYNSTQTQQIVVRLILMPYFFASENSEKNEKKDCIESLQDMNTVRFGQEFLRYE